MSARFEIEAIGDGPEFVVTDPYGDTVCLTLGQVNEIVEHLSQIEAAPTETGWWDFCPGGGICIFPLLDDPHVHIAARHIHAFIAALEKEIPE